MTNPHPPVVSVVIPCHNAADYLAETLDAILTQSWPDLEIVLVDDGSTDDPATVVATFDDERIRYLSIPASGGPSRPRNRGIAEARGQHIFFCDADDVMLPGKIEQQVRMLDDHPGLGLVFTNFRVIDARSRVLVPSFLAEYATAWRVIAAGTQPDGGLDRNLLIPGLLRANFIGTSSVAVRREVLDDVGGFDESLVSSEDLDLWLRIARRYPCAYLDIIGHSYRRHPASLMQEISIRHPQARNEVLRRQLDHDPGPLERRIIRSWLSKNHRAIGYVHERNGNGAGARDHYLESLRLWPNTMAVWGWLKAQTIGRLWSSDKRYPRV